jgi:hypothetical protein
MAKFLLIVSFVALVQYGQTAAVKGTTEDSEPRQLFGQGNLGSGSPIHNQDLAGSLQSNPNLLNS